MVGKINAEILVDKVRKMTEGLIDDEQGAFIVRRRCVDQIFSLKQIDEKHGRKSIMIKVFSDCSAMWRGWKMTGLLRGSM